MDKRDLPAEFFSNMPPFPSRMFRTPHAQHMDGDQNKGEDDHAKSNLNSNSLDRKNGIAYLKEELLLTQIGFDRGSAIDWENFVLPPKTDLHELLHYRITNHINPDVLVKIGNYEYRCHLLVLQCYSEFFTEKTRVEIPESAVSKKAFVYIYEWMLDLKKDSYTVLKRDNVLEILMASQFLKIQQLEEQCWAFINNEDLFCEDQAFMLYLEARKLKNPTILQLMVPRIQRFFLTLVSSQDFLELYPDEVIIFLSSNYICVHCEMEIFMSAIRWLMFDWDTRQKHLAEIMSCVRFSLISPWQLVDIQRNPTNPEFLLVTKDPIVAHMIEDGLAFAIFKYWNGNDSSEFSRSIETLHLKEPNERNWAGSSNISDQKKYTTYREFLLDLSKYRHMHMLALKANEQQDGMNETLDGKRVHNQYSTSELIMAEPRV
ncbi:ectoderm-neural cortex protein 1-like [Macrosteles quadrilineatus]|uniref:ectoderm-neural cortex protein 1-like n=1 Tax=Macrosteles quadrilineatus TaxID=74068 RepID=UPI0023E31534|nr:ectoderm-neural cortex protein 1-like [Macrosteles quadrilineatus]